MAKNKHLDVTRPGWNPQTVESALNHVNGWQQKGYKTVTIRVKWLAKLLSGIENLKKVKNKNNNKIKNLKEEIKTLRAQPKVILRKKV